MPYKGKEKQQSSKRRDSTQEKQPAKWGYKFGLGNFYVISVLKVWENILSNNDNGKNFY